MLRRSADRRSEPAAAPASELQALLDAAVAGILIIDHRGRIQVFNRAAEQLFGYAAAEVLGHNVSVLMTEEHRHAHDAYIERYLETRIPHIIGIGREVDAQRRDGTVFPAFLSVGQIAGTDPPRFVGFIHDISLRQQAIAAVERERDRANGYLEVAQTILVALDERHRVKMLNRRGCALLGLTEEEAVGRDWFELAIDPAERTRARAEIVRLLEDPPAGPRYIECPVRTHGGEPRLIAWQCVVLRNSLSSVTGVLCSGNDITEQRATQESIERTRSLLEEAQSIARIGNFELYLPDGRGDYWSREAYRLLGLDPDRDVLSWERAAQMVHPEDRPALEQHWARSRESGGNQSLECRIVRPDGEVHHMELRYQRSTLADGRNRVAGTLLDVTEKKRQEEQARQSQERMTHVSHLATMGEMAAGIAHELNQPLAAITTYAQAGERLLRMPEPDLEEIRDALKQIAGQALRAGEIIRRLRNLVRNRQTERLPTDVSELIGELEALTRNDARLHDVRLSFELARGLPPVLVDRIQIQQVLLNLVRNAIEAFAERGEGERSIVVRTGRSGEDLQIEVCDTGPGVTPAVVDRMFDPFCTTKPTGTGLGLAISRTIVEAHKGALRYRANAPVGACFVIRLPLAAEQSGMDER